LLLLLLVIGTAFIGHRTCSISPTISHLQAFVDVHAIDGGFMAFAMGEAEFCLGFACRVGSHIPPFSLFSFHLHCSSLFACYCILFSRRHHIIFTQLIWAVADWAITFTFTSEWDDDDDDGQVGWTQLSSLCIDMLGLKASLPLVFLILDGMWWRISSFPLGGFNYYFRSAQLCDAIIFGYPDKFQYISNPEWSIACLYCCDLALPFKCKPLWKWPQTYVPLK